MRFVRIASILALPAAIAVLGAGCASPAAAGSHNDADTTFAQMMVIHHEGAIEMAALAETKAASTEVGELATRIKAAQDPEIEQMRTWLDQWGEPAPEEVDMGGMDHAGMDMGGLDQAGAMEQLDALDGTAFDRGFLTLMIAHHQGALEMAEVEIADGANSDAVALAEAIVTAQQKEIAEMEELLGQLP